mmetsp:Transcript_24381/g.23981  ORF Transcript_24381/g.23981 Transcript_24381/m.23981 type:complete len:168 (+) Transcript_24381:2839-3342(+)
MRNSEEPWTEENGVHFTMFFNIFVFLQIFNEINCRKILEHEINVFADFFNNSLFLIIQVFTITVQIALVQFGGEPLKCSPLTFQQQAICILIGFGSILMGLLVKLIPLDCFSCFRVNEEPFHPTISALRHSKSLRRSRSFYEPGDLAQNAKIKVQRHNTMKQVLKAT